MVFTWILPPWSSDDHLHFVALVLREGVRSTRPTWWILGNGGVVSGDGVEYTIRKGQVRVSWRLL